MKTPERTTAAAFNRYLNGQVLAGSAALKWPGLFVRHCRFSARGRLLSGVRDGGAVDYLSPRRHFRVREREPGAHWITRQLGQSGGLRERAARGRDFRRNPGRPGRTQSVPFLPRLQADHRDVSAAVRPPRTDHPRSADDAGDTAQPDRNRARSRLHQRECFRPSIPPRVGVTPTEFRRQVVKNRPHAETG